MPTARSPVSAPQLMTGTSLTDTPPPTIRFSSPPPPPPAMGSSGSGFDGGAAGHGPTMPEVGEQLNGFRLVEELGRGTFGRVFLAHQAALAGRPVALKVTLRPTREPDRLARLQHTNVVPVYSVHAIGPVQLICMPFLGRRTLADALRSHRSSSGSSGGWSKKTTRAQRGSTTVTPTAPRARPGDPRPVPAAPTPPTDLVGNPAAVLRVLAQLAAGLAHAHGRGILHLDIKPGNVLLADTGEPMLLDFNLSVDAAEADRELVGGTVPYMAPEQLLDMQSRGKGSVDARTDLYALGVLAFELLMGGTPFLGSSRTLAEFDRLMAARRKGPPPLRERNPAVTPATEAIVRKLLAPDPAERYQTADDLKEDVDRQLADRPLRFARDRSVAERARKWRRRNPRLLVGCVIAGVVLAAGGTGAFAVQAAAGRSAAEARLTAQAARDRMPALRLDLTVPGEPVYAARGLGRSRELLASYGLPDDPNWRTRDALRRLPADTRAALTSDLGEALILLGTARLAESRVSSGGAADAARDEAARCARAAADCFAESSPPPALIRLGRELGLTEEHPGLPATARDHFLDAAELARAGRLADAAAGLEEATLLDPGHGAAHFLLGYCREHLGQPDRASERYAVATALLTADPRPYRLWGGAELTVGRYERAVRVYGLALGRAGGPGLDAEYRYPRGQALLRLGRYADAADDFTLAAPVYPVAARLGRAAAREKAGDIAGAAADRRAAATRAPTTAIDGIERGLAREATDPAGARGDFLSATATADARWPEAYRGLIRIALDRTDDPAEALRVADEATVRFPNLIDFHAARAVALARLGRVTDARTAAAAAGTDNVTPDAAFRVAGALARSPEAADRTAAVAWLRKAYLAGERNPARYDTAADLAGVRRTDEYRAFRAAIGELSR